MRHSLRRTFRDPGTTKRASRRWTADLGLKRRAVSGPSRDRQERRSMEFRSRAVRSLVELHEREVRSFLDVWKRFVTSGATLPEAHGDENYSSRDRLAGHTLMAARGYLTRIGEWVGRPISDLDASQDASDIAGRLPQFAEDVLAGYRRHLAAVTKEELEPQLHRT